MNIAELYDKAKAYTDIVDTDPLPYVVSTGSVLIDQASGIGGIPGGRIIEIFGPESSGKTTLAMSIVSNAQNMDLPVAIIDLEQTFDDKYASSVGIAGERNKDWFYAAPDYTEDAINLIEFLLDEDMKVIVVDSVAAMIPKAEAQGDFGEAVIGLQARLMSAALRRLKARIKQKNALVIFINQIRMKIGVQFGSPETTTGGEALKFYATMRIDIRAVGDKIMSKGEIEGQFRRVIFKKNKLAPPLRTVMVPIKFGVGIWKGAELLDLLLSEGIVTKSSSHYYYNNESIGNGKSAAIKSIEEDLDFFKGALDECPQD